MEEEKLPLEIEKKFLIRMPDLEWIKKNTNVEIAKISQTYLGLMKNGFGDRVRKMTVNNVTKYYLTSKKSLSNMTRIEIENEITKKQYYEYMSNKNRRGTLHKTRYIISMNDLKYEIDIYPFWEETAILEIELESENQKYIIPDFIEIIGDVTGNRDYSNSSLVNKFFEKNKYYNPPKKKTYNKKKYNYKKKKYKKERKVSEENGK